MGHDRVLYQLTYVVWYVLYVVETFLILRFLFRLFGVDGGVPFTHAIYTVSAGLLTPFTYLFGIANVAGSILEWSTLLAMFVYWLIAWGMIELITMNRSITSVDLGRGLRAQDIGHPLA